MYVVGNKVKTVYGLLEIVKVNKTSVICDLHGDKIKVMFRQLDIMNKWGDRMIFSTNKAKPQYIYKPSHDGDFDL